MLNFVSGSLSAVSPITVQKVFKQWTISAPGSLSFETASAMKFSMTLMMTNLLSLLTDDMWASKDNAWVHFMAE
jgi:hypothetical protein